MATARERAEKRWFQRARPGTNLAQWRKQQVAFLKRVARRCGDIAAFIINDLEEQDGPFLWRDSEVARSTARAWVREAREGVRHALALRTHLQKGGNLSRQDRRDFVRQILARPWFKILRRRRVVVMDDEPMPSGGGETNVPATGAT